jgi:predicted Zn-dependent peptidase
MKTTFCVLLALMLAFSHSISAQNDGDVSGSVKVTHFTLDNGLEVYLNEDHNTPDVFGAVAVKAGSKYDPADATGMAHYLEHMCFKGTQDMGTTDYTKEKPLLDSIEWLYTQLKKTTDDKAREDIQKHINDVSVRAAQYAIPNEMDRMLKSIGSKNLNAFTSFEEIVYHNSFPSHEVNKWLDLYSHRFINPVFRLFQPELEVVYEEKNRGEDNMFSKVFETYMKNFFKVHPYGQQTTIGRTEDLKNPDLARMREYYNTYFVANNMALVMSGDFNTNEIIPIIKADFGKWPAGKVPSYPKYEEKPFNGRELVSVKMTPVKVGIMGYRTVPNNHPDDIPLQVMSYILNNQNQTGLLDELQEDGKLQAAQVLPMTLNDAGALGVIYVPKIVGQSFDDAEKLVLDAIGKVKSGNFDPGLLTAAKNNLRVDYFKGLEDDNSKSMSMVDCFIQGISWEKFSNYPNEVNNVTMEDVERVANQYLGSNYMVLQSKMGLPKKDKLKKPDFKPVMPKDSVKSEYANYFDKLPDGKPMPHFIDFSKDVTKTDLNPGEVLWMANNPVNDIFSLQLVYHVGYWQIPGLSEAAGYVGDLGAGDENAAKFKKEMSQLGCSYNIWVSGDRMNVYLSGLEENMQPAIDLLQRLINTPRPEKKKMDVLVSNIATSRKLENGDPENAAGILNEYLHYGKYSSYLSRYSMDELKKMDSNTLVTVFKKALDYPVSVHYVGRKPIDQVAGVLRGFTFTRAMNFSDTAHGKLMAYNQPAVYVLYRKDARQTHIYYYAKSQPYDSATWPYASAFNSYFGGDMSSLAFQEVREFRSLAYSVYTAMHSNTNDNMSFDGYLGCQSDKTSEALSTMNGLFKNMPEKQDRLDAIRTGLINGAYDARPSFRYISQSVERLENQGFKDDPNKNYLHLYQHIQYGDIDSYYKKHVQQLPISMAVTGNEKDVPMAELQKYGKVIVVKEDEIVKK